MPQTAYYNFGGVFVRKSWVVTLAAIFAGIAIAVAQNKVAPCLGVLQDAFSLDMSSAGWLSSVFNVMGIIMAIPAAVLVNAAGPRKACLFSLGITITGTLIGLLSSAFPVLLISRVIEGIGTGIIAVTVPAIIAMYFPPNRQGLPMGIWSSWQFVAQALCFFFGMAATNKFGWRGVWGVGFGFGLLILILCVFVLHMPQDTDAKAVSDTQKLSSLGIFNVAKQSSVQAICASMFLFCFACFGFVTWAPTCWSETLGFDLEHANWLISLFAILSIPAVLIVGWLIDRIAHKKLAFFSTFGYAVMVSSAFLLPGKGFMIPYAVIYPFFEGAASTCLWTIVPQTVREEHEAPTAIALFNLCSNCGMLLGPPFAGAIIQAFGWRVMALPLFLSMLGCAAGVFFAKERVYGK